MFNEFLMSLIGLFLGIYIGCYYFAPHPDPNEQVGLEWVGLMSLAVYTQYPFIRNGDQR